MDAELPLAGLYLHLVRSGFPISVRDYQDAVVALRRGYGTPTRADLLWLCTSLWARTDQEASRLDRLFRHFPWPASEEVDGWLGRPVAPSQTRKPDSSRALRGALMPGQEDPNVEFVAPTESGVGLPAVTTPKRTGEVFIFTPRPLVSLRTLIVAWRRFRVAQRFGPPVELDVDATIEQQARRGHLLSPVLLPERRNQTRLVVLVDLGPGMSTWRYIVRLLAESLAMSQMAHTVMFYFDGAPDDDLYEHESLSRLVPVSRLLRGHPRSSLVIVSDAGAATNTRDRDRIAQVRSFIAAVKTEWSPITWLNPMPRGRWKRTSASDIARLKGLTMYPFTDDGLVQAVDFLRGNRD